MTRKQSETGFRKEVGMEIFGFLMFPIGLTIAIITMFPLAWRSRLRWARFLHFVFYRDLPKSSIYMRWIAYCNSKYGSGKTLKQYILFKQLQKMLKVLDEEELNLAKRRERMIIIYHWVILEYEGLGVLQ